MITREIQRLVSSYTLQRDNLCFSSGYQYNPLSVIILKIIPLMGNFKFYGGVSLEEALKG